MHVVAESSPIIDFLDEQERLYFSQAKLGVETEQFLKSDVGRFLHGCALQELAEVKDKLLNCNPNRAKGRREIRELQNRAQQAKRFMRWCAEAIESGRVAEYQLEEYRSIS